METHTAIFKGVVKEIVWDYYPYYGARGYGVETYGYNMDVVRYNQNGFREIATPLIMETIWSGEVSKPIFEINEEVWINELNLLVKIIKKYRTTNGEMIYETTHSIKDIATENTEKSRLRAIDLWFSRKYSDFEKFEELKCEFLESEEEVIEPETELKVKPEVEPEGYNLEVEEKQKEKTWFGWLNFFKKD